MSDSTPGGTPQQPPQNPYGQPPQPPADPYGQPTAPADPYGQQVGGENPYGQAPFPAQQPTNPYGAPAGTPGPNPYAAQQPGPPPGPLGDGFDIYGRPLGSDQRPGTVTAAGWITLVLSGLMFLLFSFITLAMIVAKDDVLREIDNAIREQGTTSTTFDAESAFGVVVAVLLVFVVWCLITCMLAVFTLRRSNAARITLVVSAAVAALLSLLGIGSLVTAVPLLGCVGVIILLFTGGAGDWFARRRRF